MTSLDWYRTSRRLESDDLPYWLKRERPSLIDGHFYYDGHCFTDDSHETNVFDFYSYRPSQYSITAMLFNFHDEFYEIMSGREACWCPKSKKDYSHAAHTTCPRSCEMKKRYFFNCSCRIKFYQNIMKSFIHEQLVFWNQNYIPHQFGMVSFTNRCKVDISCFIKGRLLGRFATFPYCHEERHCPCFLFCSNDWHDGYPYVHIIDELFEKDPLDANDADSMEVNTSPLPLAAPPTSPVTSPFAPPFDESSADTVIVEEPDSPKYQHHTFIIEDPEELTAPVPSPLTGEEDIEINSTDSTPCPSPVPGQDIPSEDYCGEDDLPEIHINPEGADDNNNTEPDLHCHPDGEISD